MPGRIGQSYEVGAVASAVGIAVAVLAAADSAAAAVASAAVAPAARALGPPFCELHTRHSHPGGTSCV